MYLIIARHGERLDYVDPQGWLASAAGQERPWDPPLTDEGRAQAAALGTRLARELRRLQLPPVSMVVTSPFVRAVQTAEAAAASVAAAADGGAVAPPPLYVDAGLAEVLSEDWLRAWAVPGAACEWGGPPHCRSGVPVPHAALHPAAAEGVAAWVRTAAQLAEAGEVGPRGARDVAAAPPPPPPRLPTHDGSGGAGVFAEAYAWRAEEDGGLVEETFDALGPRVAAAAERAVAAAAAGGEEEDVTVLCVTHGAPLARFHQHAVQSSAAVFSGYASWFLYSRERGDGKGGGEEEGGGGGGSGWVFQATTGSEFSSAPVDHRE